MKHDLKNTISVTPSLVMQSEIIPIYVLPYGKFLLILI